MNSSQFVIDLAARFVALLLCCLLWCVSSYLTSWSGPRWRVILTGQPRSVVKYCMSD